MSDETPETTADPAATMASWLIILTSVMLLGAIFIVLGILKDHYQRGMLA